MNSSLCVALIALLCTIGANAYGQRGPCVSGWTQGSRPQLVGSYRPQCSPFGYFKVIQFHPSTGYAWCVNPETGVKIEGSDVAPGAGKPQCGKCLFELTKYLVHGHISLRPLGSGGKPACDETGRFQPVQSNPSTGYSWCVDPETGDKKEGTDAAPGSPQPNCEATNAANAEADARPLGPCELAKAQQGQPALGAFVPTCDSQGFYTSIQHHEGYRFCVDTNTGEQLPNSPRYGPGEQDKKLPCENN